MMKMFSRGLAHPLRRLHIGCHYQNHQKGNTGDGIIIFYSTGNERKGITMEQETKTTRVRANFTTSAKGIAQVDITTEAETVEEMNKLLYDAITSVEQTLEAKSIQMAHKQAKRLED
jgi:hypothetical protein